LRRAHVDGRVEHVRPAVDEPGGEDVADLLEPAAFHLGKTATIRTAHAAHHLSHQVLGVGRVEDEQDVAAGRLGQFDVDADAFLVAHVSLHVADIEKVDLGGADGGPARRSGCSRWSATVLDPPSPSC